MIGDKETSDFLYTMLAQLEVRNIDWNVIAKQNNISSAHAARMRWHRLNKAKSGRETKARVSKKSSKDRKDKGSDKPLLGSSEASKRELYEKFAMGLEDPMEEEEEDEELLNLVHPRVKVEDQDVGRSIIKQEDMEMDVKHPLYIWDGTTMSSVMRTSPLPPPMMSQPFDRAAPPHQLSTHTPSSQALLQSASVPRARYGQSHWATEENP